MLITRNDSRKLAQQQVEKAEQGSFASDDDGLGAREGFVYF